MPNWCSNEITITGDVSEIVKALESIDNKQERNVFKTLLSIQESEDWYNDNLKNFGTKWDVSYEECYPVQSENELILTPYTAWSPPIEFGVNLAKKYGVEVEMYYYEGGMDYCGKTIIKSDGDYVEDDYKYLEGLYHFDADYFWMEIQSHIEYAVSEGLSAEEFLKDFPYVENQKELLEAFKQEAL